MAFNDVSALAYNERIKLISTTLQAFGVGLTIAAVGAWWSQGFRFPLAIWLGVAILNLSLALSVLRFMDDRT